MLSCHYTLGEDENNGKIGRERERERAGEVGEGGGGGERERLGKETASKHSEVASFNTGLEITSSVFKWIAA